MMLVMLWLLCERRACDQCQHQNQPGTNFAAIHVKSSPPDYLYQVPLPRKLIQIKLGVDLPRVNRVKGTFRRWKVWQSKPSRAGGLCVRTNTDDSSRATIPR
jgi:hypothetical protein